jgi:predicted PhzF superfamily epimerase YddE/YHI9
LQPAKPPKGVILDLDFSPSPIGSHFYTKLESQNPAVERYQVRRMMVDGVEDPATGSAAAALAGYLSMKNSTAGSRHRFEMIQGVEMGRVSTSFVLDNIGGANNLDL